MNRFVVRANRKIRERWQNFETKASGKLGKTKILPSVFFRIKHNILPCMTICCVFVYLSKCITKLSTNLLNLSIEKLKRFLTT